MLRILFIDVTATWAVKTLTDITLVLKQCSVVQDSVVVNVIEGCCYSNALKVAPLAIDDPSQVGFNFKTFLIDGTASNEQVMKCIIKLCTDTSNRPTSNDMCPNEEGKAAFQYTVNGFSAA